MKKELGILFNRGDWQKAKMNKGHEKIRLYLEAAKKHDLHLIFFTLEDINPVNLMVYGSYQRNKRWHQKKMRLPKVIHNRAFYEQRESRMKLSQLLQKGTIIYNSWNGYNKLYIHNLLQRNERLSQHLPHTLSFNRKNLQYFMQKPSFFLKPTKGSVGKGILKINKLSEDKWQILHQYKYKVVRRSRKKSNLYPYLTQFVGNQKYILQETISLITYHDNPVDIRVSVQKNAQGKWETTGMVGKVAHYKKGTYLSNVAQGGKVMRMEKLLSFSHGEDMIQKIMNEISNLGVEMATYLQRHLVNLADVGFDIGIDKEGKIYFIEMNSRDQRYSFLLAGLYDTFRKIYDNPMAYGKYLLDLQPINA